MILLSIDIAVLRPRYASILVIESPIRYASVPFACAHIISQYNNVQVRKFLKTKHLLYGNVMLRRRLFASSPLHILNTRLAHFSFKAALSSLFDVRCEQRHYRIINFRDELINNSPKRSAYTPIACTKVTLCPNFRPCKAFRDVERHDGDEGEEEERT